VDVSNKRND
jgi:hypothetical protein